MVVPYKGLLYNGGNMLLAIGFMRMWEFPPLFVGLIIFFVFMLVKTAKQNRRHVGDTDQKVCRGCGTGHPSMAVYCRRCGQKLT